MTVLNKKSKNRILLLITCLIIIISGFLNCTYVSAEEYDLSVEEGDTFVYEITEWDKDIAKDAGVSMEDLVGKDTTKGAQIAYEIGNLEETSKAWIIELRQWDWTEDADDFQSYSNAKALELEVEKDPENIGFNVEINDIKANMFTVIPEKVNSYLKGVDWTIGHDVNDTTLSAILVSGALVSFEYYNNGTLKKYTAEYNGDLFLEVKHIGNILVPENPIIWIILGVVIGVVVLVVVLIIRKKKKVSEYGEKPKKDKKVGKISKTDLKRDLMDTGISKQMMKSRSKWEKEYESTKDRSDKEEAALAVNKCPSCGWFLSSKADKCIKCGWER